MRPAKLSEFPSEAFDLIWAILPLHDLFRCRLVCKAWDRMIREPYVKSLRLKIPRQPSCMLIMPKMLISTNLHFRGESGSCWGFLDVTAKRFYKLSNDGCIIEYITDHPDSTIVWNQYTMAADKNLMYVMCETRLRSGPQHHIICDLVTKSCHDIPSPPTPVKYTNDIVVMAVDHATKPGTTSYQLVRMETYFPGKLGVQNVQVYDSTTELWMIPTHLPEEQWSCSNIFWRGAFYALVVDVTQDPQLCLTEGQHLLRKLKSCDLKTGRWSLVPAEVPPLAHPRDKCQLVVVLDRMFVVEFIGPNIVRESLWDRRNSSKRVRRKFVIKLIIWEVVLVGNDRLQKVVEMPRYPKYPGNMVKESQELYGEPVVAVGCGNSIVITSWIGRCVGFELVRNCWHELPLNNEKLRSLLNFYHKGIFAAAVDF